MVRSAVDAAPRSPAVRARPERRRRTPFPRAAQVLGELLVTAGLIPLLFVG